METFQTDYRGDKSVTESGLKCKEWDAYHDGILITRYPFADLRNHSHCRNPSPHSRVRAWCYTTDPNVEWEYCDVSSCDGVNPGVGLEDHQSSNNETNANDANADTSLSANKTTCGTALLQQSDYRGEIHQTISNKTCQHWNAQEPHYHKFQPQDRPDDNLLENFCRNPDRSEKAWCYTTDPDTLWEYCNVPDCY